jgi:hypothetical protein
MISDPVKAARLVAQAGVALFGADWRGPMAQALGMNLRTIQRVAVAAERGEGYPLAPGAFADLARLALGRSEALAALASELGASDR